MDTVCELSRSSTVLSPNPTPTFPASKLSGSGGPPCDNIATSEIWQPRSLACIVFGCYEIRDRPETPRAQALMSQPDGGMRHPRPCSQHVCPTTGLVFRRQRRSIQHAPANRPTQSPVALRGKPAEPKTVIYPRPVCITPSNNSAVNNSCKESATPGRSLRSSSTAGRSAN